MDFIHVEGSQTERPLPLDATTSKTVVYVRKNIERVTKTDENGTREVWEYDEAQLPMSDYAAISSAVISEVTPYKASKTAYIDDTDIVFANIPEGNMSVYVKDDNGGYPSYTVERVGSTVTVYFEPLEYITTVTISIS